MPETPVPETPYDDDLPNVDDLANVQDDLTDAPGEATFHQRRAHHERQETRVLCPGRHDGALPASYGPNRAPAERPQPYMRPVPEEVEVAYQSFDADLAEADTTTFPEGWHLRDGYLTLDSLP